MAKKNLPTPNELRNLLRYEATTGKLYSRKSGKEVFTNTHHSGYKKGAINNRTYIAQRICMTIQAGQWPNGEVDHINGDKADNRLCNLRVVTKSQNQRNAKMRKDNTAGHVGVSLRANGKWQAYISLDGGRAHIGTFNCRSAAIVARKRAQVSHGYTERHGT